MRIVTVGIDLAKNLFAVHGVDEAGKPALVRLTGHSAQASPPLLMFTHPLRTKVK